MVPPSESKPPANQWPWVVGTAVVIAGLLVAVALYSSRSHRVETVYVTATPETRVITTAPPTTSSESPGTSANAADAKAQANLTQAVVAARSIFSTTGTLTRANSLGLAPGLPDLTFVPSSTASTSPDTLSLSVTPATWSAAALSDSGTCWWVSFNASTSATTYGSGPTCTGIAAIGATDDAWPETSGGASGTPSASASPSL